MVGKESWVLAEGGEQIRRVLEVIRGKVLGRGKAEGGLVPKVEKRW
jgi:hypothetical protein